MPIPLLVPIAVGIGVALWEAFSDKGGAPAAGLAGKVHDDGDGLHLSFVDFPQTPHTTLVLHGRSPQGGYLRAANKFHADADGDFVAARPLVGPTCDLYIPHGAVLGAEDNKLRVSVRRVQQVPGGSQPSLLSEDLLALDAKAQPYSPVGFLRPLLTLMKSLAEADASFTREEVRYIREFVTEHFAPTDTQFEELRLFLKAPCPPVTADTASMLLQRIPSAEPQALCGLLHGLAAADGDVNAAEARWLSDLLPRVGMPAGDVEQFLAALGLADHRQLESHLRLLGLNGQPTSDELRQAWRKAMRDFHPDRYQATALPDTVKAVLAQKSADINAAYDALRKAYGYNDR